MFQDNEGSNPSLKPKRPNNLYKYIYAQITTKTYIFCRHNYNKQDYLET